MKKKLVVLCLSSLLLLTGCGKEVPKLADGTEVVAEIEGKQIIAEDLYEALKEQYGTSVLVNLIDEYIISKEFTDEDGAKSYANQQYKYLKASYEANGANVDEEILRYYESINAFKEMLAKDYKSTKVAEKYVSENLTDEEINKYYKDEIFGTMSVRHILVIPEYEKGAKEDEIKAAEDKALQEAKDLITQIKNGADFATLAKENSDDTGTATNGGLFENFSKENTDAAFWKASYELKNDTYTETPVKSQFGYHIIYKISSNEKPSLEDSKEKITSALVNKKLNESENSVAIYWSKIREKYNLNIYETTIDKTYNKTESNLK